MNYKKHCLTATFDATDPFDDLDPHLAQRCKIVELIQGNLIISSGHLQTSFIDFLDYIAELIQQFDRPT